MIYVFLASGFEEIEAITAIDILRRAELDVKVVGVGGKNIVGSHGIKIVADLTDKEADAAGLEMIVLPGGMPGTLNLENSIIVKDFINLCIEFNLYIGAICAAPSILGHMGILNGRKATCYPGFDSQLTGATYTNQAVTVDDKIITGKGPGASKEFALMLVEILLGKQRADILAASLMSI